MIQLCHPRPRDPAVEAALVKVNPGLEWFWSMHEAIDTVPDTQVSDLITDMLVAIRAIELSHPVLHDVVQPVSPYSPPGLDVLRRLESEIVVRCDTLRDDPRTRSTVRGVWGSRFLGGVLNSAYPEVDEEFDAMVGRPYVPRTSHQIAHRVANGVVAYRAERGQINRSPVALSLDDVVEFCARLARR